MPKALVLGVNGQDGSYAAEALIRRGYSVVGVGRQSTSRFVESSARFAYRQLDLVDGDALGALLAEEFPDVVFHLAAIHGAAGFAYEPVFASMLAVNVTTVHCILEFARTQRRDMRLVYANSAKVFPAPLQGAVDEETPMRATCLYSIGKIAALELIRQYRKQHGIRAANLILFNHESPRRGDEYFLPTVAAGMARARLRRDHRFAVKTLDFWMDWSSAEELMDIAVDIAERACDDDFALASGHTRHARDVVQQWFARNGLDYTQHVYEVLSPQALAPTFEVLIERLQRRVGRRPARTMESILDELANGVRSV